jgi:hypothetical protein
MEHYILSIISLVVAGLAFLFSIYSHFSASKLTEKINCINLKTKYYEAVFDKYLIYIIPEKRSLVRFDETGHLTDFQPLVDELSNEKCRALLRFENKSFFDELKEVIRDAEDYLIYEGNKTHDMDEQADTVNKITDRITQIYECINKYRMGEK